MDRETLAPCNKRQARGQRPGALFLLNEQDFNMIFEPEIITAISERTAPSPWLSPEAVQSGVWPETEVIFSSWGMPLLDAGFLERFPRLKAVFYAAGTVKYFITEEVWKRDLVICSAAAANAVPVAEYSAAAIILSLKLHWHELRRCTEPAAWRQPRMAPGNYGTRVGLLSLGKTGSMTAQRLADTDLELVAYDPFVDPQWAKTLGVRLVGLEELFQSSQVVSIHTPLLPATRHLITSDLLRLMPTHATLINTSRGGLIDETGLIATLRRRPDLVALLDVTDPEPPAAGSPLYALPNVILTPHIAGSLGRECRRMGRMAYDEFLRWVEGRPLQHRVTRENLATMA